MYSYFSFSFVFFFLSKSLTLAIGYGTDYTHYNVVSLFKNKKKIKKWSSFVACTLHWGVCRSIGALLSTSWSCLGLMMVQHICCTLRMLPRITLAVWLNTRFSQSKSYIIPVHPILKVALYSYLEILPTLPISPKKTVCSTSLHWRNQREIFGLEPPPLAIIHCQKPWKAYVMQHELVVLKQTTLCKSLVLQDFPKVEWMSSWSWEELGIAASIAYAHQASF